VGSRCPRIKWREMGAAIHAAPHLKKKRNGGSVWDSRCLRSKWKEIGGDVWHAHRPRLKRKEMGAMCGMHTAPVRKEKTWGDIRHPRLKQKRNGVTYAAPIRNGRKTGVTCGMHTAPVRIKKKWGQRDSRCPLLERISPKLWGA